MSLGAWVERVNSALEHAHSLFRNPLDSGAASASGAATRLANGGALVTIGRERVSELSGEFPTGYGRFANGAGSAIDDLAGADDTLGGRLSEAAGSERSGWAASGSVVDAAARDSALLGPWSNTPAGEKALIAALRSRVAQQERVIAAYRLRDARLAARLRSLTYHRGGSGVLGGGSILGGKGLAGGGLGTGSPGGGLAKVVDVARRWVGARDLPEGPGADAAEAALSRRGSPYAWGAKGPSAFDCSGLTQWSWARAGVQLGGDTYSQINEGIPVPAGEVRAGDLIFPTSSFGEGGRPGPAHVQLAISPTEVIHAPQSGDVVRIAPMPPSFVARRPTPGAVAQTPAG